jgi:hypothetical protein
MALGPAVRRGLLPHASVVDVATPVLYIIVVPIGRDIDGSARSALYDQAFTEERPLTFIPSHER